LLAVTVRIEVAPDVTAVGLALIITAGDVEDELTVTVAFAVAGVDPEAPVAVAVYVVVADGFTISVPPETASV
jgi:hypothetical protein